MTSTIFCGRQLIVPPYSNVLFASLYRSGLYLAEAGRMECATCVAGLRQYGLCFEEAFDRADEVEAAFQKTSAQPIQSNSTIEAPLNPHSSMSVVPQRSISSTQNATYPFPPNLGHMPIQPSTNNVGCASMCPAHLYPNLIDPYRISHTAYHRT
jgi:hypothetical protein